MLEWQGDDWGDGVQALRPLTENKKVDRATALLAPAIFDVAMPDSD